MTPFPGRKKRMGFPSRDCEYAKYPEGNREKVTVVQRETDMKRCVL